MIVSEWCTRVVHESSARDYVSGARERCTRVVHESDLLGQTKIL